jgi:small subunit ribosomal protein S5
MAETKFKSRNNREDKNQFSDEPVMQEVVIHVNRVARVVKGGRRFRFQALVAVGDGGSQVGVGVSKGADVQAAVVKAVAVAKKNIITVPLFSATIPHDIESKVGGSRIMLKPASPGTGIIAGGTIRAIINLTGINNLLSKSLGSSNKINTAYATIDALRNLVPKDLWMIDHRIIGLKNAAIKNELVKKPEAENKSTAVVKKVEPKVNITTKSKKSVAAKKPIINTKPVAKKTAVAKKSTTTKKGDK